VILFLSAPAFVTVVVGTWLSGRRIEPPAFEFAAPLRAVTAPGVWDRLGMWTLVAIILVAVAYAYPLAHLLSVERFGSPPFQPFLSRGSDGRGRRASASASQPRRSFSSGRNSREHVGASRSRSF
jgi:hypothetical protein